MNAEATILFCFIAHHSSFSVSKLADVFSSLPLAGNIDGRIAQQRRNGRGNHVLA